MKIIIKAIIPIFLTAAIFSSCNSLTPTSQYVPTKATAIPTFVSATLTVTTLPPTKPEVTFTPPITDDISLWESIDPLPSNVSVTEYALPPEKDPTKNDGLFQFIPTQAWSIGKINAAPTPAIITLEEIGYELRTVYTDGGLPYSQQLYRDDKLLFDGVTHVSNIYNIPTHSTPIIAFVIEVNLGRENFVIQDDEISVLGEYAIDTSAPVLYKDELLWARTYADHVEIRKSNGDIVFAFTIPWSPNHRHNFRAWNGHWILEVNGTVIEDGEILNQKFGFQEVFLWSLIKDQPTYFFRRASRIGLSYGEQILPLNYQNVAHDLCCSPAQNNPTTGVDSVRFFGERDGIWYYVVMEFR